MNQINYSKALGVPGNLVLDSPERIRLNGSAWNRLINYQQKKALDLDVANSVVDFFQKRYGFDDIQTFRPIWKEVGVRVWESHLPLTSETLKAIDQSFKDRLLYHGPGIPAPIESGEAHNIVAREAALALLHGKKLTSKVLTKQSLNAVLIKKNTELMQQLRAELQREMNALADSLPQTPDEERIWRIFLGNIIALLPYAYPSDYDTFVIPVLEKGVCRKITYGVEVLEINVSTLSTPITALGMVPKDNQVAPPILSFIGTTFPAGDGFAATLLADSTPGRSVGEHAFDVGKNVIANWLEGKNDVYVTGMSLGGALALHTLRHHEDKLARVAAYSPPGFNENCWKKDFNGDCKISIYTQKGDIVPKLGFWPTGSSVSLYKVFAHQDSMSKRPLSSHARAFTGLKKLTMVKQNPAEENSKFWRKVLTELYRYIGPVILFLPVSCCLLLYRVISFFLCQVKMVTAKAKALTN